MRKIPICLLILAGACTADRPADQQDTAAKVVTAVADSTARGAPEVPTTGATVEDSILDGMLPGRFATTPAGDTLQDLGGGMIDEHYSISVYKKNGDDYFRLQYSTGHMADGRAIWRFITRVAVGRLVLPDQLMFAGQCGTAAGTDNDIIAVARFVQEEEIFKTIRRAWRVDRKAESVTEIPTAGIQCTNPGGD